MKTFSFILVFFCLNLAVQAQVKGKIKNDQRKITKPIKYTVPYSKPGVMIFKIVVDQNGNVKTCQLDEYKSTINVTPVMKGAQASIKNRLKFEAGHDWPPLHKGYVEITTTQ